MKDRAVVLEINGRRATVLLPGGQFRTIKTRPLGMVVGQEVWVSNPRARRIWQAGAVVASTLALVLVSLADVMAPAVPLAVAVVSVDINPSVNLMVGNHQQVIAAVGLDRAGRRILSQYRPTNVPVVVAVEEITQWAVQDGYVSTKTPTLLIGGAFSGSVPSWFPTLARQETDMVKKKHWPLEVVRVATQNKDVVASMGRSPISVGRYLLWQHDRHQGRGWTQALAQAVPLTQLVGNLPPSSQGSSSAPPVVGITSNPVILPSIPSASIGLSIPSTRATTASRSKNKGHSKHPTHHGQPHRAHSQAPDKSSPSESASTMAPGNSGSVPPSGLPSLPTSVSGYPSQAERSLSHMTSGLPSVALNKIFSK